MAAIKPHLAQEGETTELQSRYWECSGSGSALNGLGDDGETCPAPEEIAQEAHAELMNVAWIRQALIEKMSDRKIWIQYDVDGTPSIAISKPVTGPAWNPSAGSRATTILGWTTKMGAPSFSLPAGAPSMGGACPGAIAGQSITPREGREGPARRVLKVLKEYPGDNEKADGVHITKTVCEFCYAEGGQYATSGVQNAQIMRYAWAKRAVEKKADGRFVRQGHQDNVSEFYSVMLDAIERADYVPHEEPAHFTTQRIFRIHDSGDFFSSEYFSEWKKITLYFHHKVGGEGLTFNEDGSIATEGTGHPHPVWFWAPSRVWATKMVTLIAESNEVYGDNFAIRPSAYHINQYGPFIPGWAAPSTVYEHKHKPEGQGKAFDWDCRAYAVEKGPSCRGAKSNPKGKAKGAVGCRECWLNPTSAVNYTLHL
jgi:hypothetical protein